MPKPDATFNARVTLRRRPPTRAIVSLTPPTNGALEATIKAAVEAAHPAFEVTVEANRADK